MKKMFLSKWAASLGVAALLTVGMATQASAVPSFTVDPGAFGSARAPFQADFTKGGTSTLLTFSDPAAGTVSGSGYLQLDSFSLNNVSIAPGASGLGVDYQLWAQFSYTTQLLTGSYGLPGSTYALTSLSFELYGEALTGLNTTFTGATAGLGGATAPQVVHGANATLLGTGSLISGIAALLQDAGGNIAGTALNTLSTFSLTDDGKAFYIDPVPFYTMAFAEFNNTAQGVSQYIDPDSGILYIAIGSTSGGVDFNTVPEPASLALLGFGLGALALLSRRRGSKFR